MPISAILFGGRRMHSVPLVTQAFDWRHGVFLGATMASRTTATAAGEAGVLRQDPMAMLPFCGYNMGDYVGHWLGIGSRLSRPPAIFHVNWFRKDAAGQYLWPGYGDNVRALVWMLDRIRGRGDAVETPIGFVPTAGSLHLEGMSVSQVNLQELLSVPRDEWLAELPDFESLFRRIGDRVPIALWDELEALRRRLASVL